MVRTLFAALAVSAFAQITLPNDSIAEESAPIGNTIHMQLMKVRSGEFLQGALPNDRLMEILSEATGPLNKLDLLGLFPPQRKVKITKDYYIGVHEVTVKQFRAFIDDSNYVTSAEKDGRGGTGMFAGGGWGQARQFTWKHCGFPLHDDSPVVNVSLNDAKAFCKWLSKKEGKSYRLPTESEWEYACRGGTNTQFCCGNYPKNLEGYANVADQSLARVTPGLPWPVAFDDSCKYLSKVGQFKPNSNGLYDMHGNAMEWCSDRFSYFDGLPAENTLKRTLIRHAKEEGGYVMRGGNWFNEPIRTGSAVRIGAPANHRMSLISFRVAMEVRE